MPLILASHCGTGREMRRNALPTCLHPLRPAHHNDSVALATGGEPVVGFIPTSDNSADSPVEAAIAALGMDHERGATDLAREALDILSSAAASFPEEGLGAYLDGVGVLIVLTRPGVAAVKNAVSRALADGPLTHPGQAKRAFDRARSWIDYAAKATVEETAAMIPDGATIVTCNYSGTVLQACAAAVELGTHVQAIVLTSRVGDIAYGERMAEELVAAGVAAQVYPDEVDLKALGPITMGLLGADRIGPDGLLVSGIPSRLLAEHLQGIAPLYIAGETFKLDDAQHLEEGMESVPRELIEGYVTDRGVVQTDQV
jgi:translation initiation factor 2B subunit (eIF-2B alpha/beta/delta family)